MYRKILYFALFAFVSGVSALAGGADEQRSDKKIHLVIATDASFPPMEFVDDNGEIVGFDVDLMKAAAEAGSFTFEFINIPWDQIFVGLAAGEYEAIMSAVTITEERKKTMDVSTAYLTMAQVLVVNPDFIVVDKLEDLSGQVIGVLAGSLSAYELAKFKDRYGLLVETYYDSLPLIDDLLAGFLAAIVIDEIQAELVMDDIHYTGRLRIVGEPVAQELYGIAVNKGDKKILNTINAGLDSVLYTNIYEQIVHKWFK
ncbi:MAG: transporter substrate-binding domain-containing protein [Spirochaetaceae bacterium]|nr:MAG: transporter substrate-binding domain-containing protein [Spirochaetaceae bacterium]